MNKKRVLACLFVTSIPFQSFADGWLDSITSIFSSNTQDTAAVEQNAATSINGLLGTLTSSLGITHEQAEGGLASIMNYVKGNVTASDFSQIGESLPGLSSIMKAVPEVDNLASGNGLSGLMDKVGSYSDSLKGANEVKKQFESLGLSPDMISQFVSQIQNYLNTPQGAEAKKLVMQGVGKLLG
ncbi:DUF2780 domain-containing protein [Neptunicella sp.]|uniref:DUF2780 domain-containing protein n=1 Tax=Neptunicella sp. TaxID=2125986 RepID=UPI003F6914B5